MRTLSADALAALDSGRFTTRILVKALVRAADPFCIWDDIGTITVDGDDYVGAAGRFTVEPAPSSLDQASRAMKITLSGLDPIVTALIEQAGWHQAPIFVQRAVITTDAPAVLHLMPEFSGFLDQMIPRERVGGTSTIEFLCETDSRELARSGSDTRSDTNQRLRDPDDGCLSFAADATNTPIEWGRVPEPAPAKPRGVARLIDKLF